MSDDDTRAFVFTGDALAFDLVNTEVVIRRRAADWLLTTADLEQWWQQAGEVHHLHGLPVTPIDADVLSETKRLRAALRRLFTAVVEKQPLQSHDLDTLNAVLATGYVHLTTTPDNEITAQARTHDGSLLLLTVAQSAAWLLTECEPERLRKCKNEHCVLMFYDTTKNGSRVWCSTDCMNRARSAERYKQHKAAD